MNYPVWQLDWAGGGLLIALIAVVHVYVAHFAVGGGLLLVLVERKGLVEKSAAIMQYAKMNTGFFLLLTMVFGGMTGVGIWFTIALLNPAATSALIHIFVFGWAIEWVFFFCEILSLFLYYYTFGRLDAKRHLILGWIYFVCAWMSLFWINGIIDFMLTPGDWLVDHNFWSGFFNPTFWPALFFRTFLAFMIAGLFGFVTAVFIREEQTRHAMVRFSGKWLLGPFMLLMLSAWWYKSSLPASLQELIFTNMPELTFFIKTFALLSPMLVLGGLLMAVLRPQKVRFPIAALLLLIGLVYMGCFEFIREGGRRPYIISNYMYSTAILKADLAKVQEQGVLQSARWLKNREVTDENRMKAGRELYDLLCLSCHSIGGPLNDILPMARRFSPSGMNAFLASMGKANSYMPPFAGNNEEREVLADFLTLGLVHNVPRLKMSLAQQDVTPYPYDPEAQYLLAAWALDGMGFTSNPDMSGLDFSPGLPEIRAQLIRRGEAPELLSSGVSVIYTMEVNGVKMSGVMAGEGGYFRAEISALANVQQPYHLVEVEAHGDGAVLARTRLMVAQSSEVDCNHCHGQDLAAEKQGLSRETAAHILERHDTRSKTALKGRFDGGEIIVCAGCHADVSRGMPGQKGILNLSASIHGFHAAYMAKQGAGACAFCHPTAAQGASQSLRGLHHSLGFDCLNCHGSMAEHGAALLKAEVAAGKSRAGKLLKVLGDTSVPVESVVARIPWLNMPDCLACHVDFQPPETDSAFNLWTKDKEEIFHNRKGDEGVLFCAACHNEAHVLYPAKNPYGTKLDVQQPMQYQGNSLPLGANRGCKTCHTVDMEDEMHHSGSLADFRNDPGQ
jgi:cytochrome bd-type quinol oxidase subunit 1